MAKNVVLITSDLMFASRARISAEQAGVHLEVSAAWQPSREVPDSAKPLLVVLDLSAVGANVSEIVNAWRSAMPEARVIAFGPHVHEGRLAAAREACCDAVLTKGQFSAQMSALFSSAGNH